VRASSDSERTNDRERVRVSAGSSCVTSGGAVVPARAPLRNDVLLLLLVAVDDEDDDDEEEEELAVVE